MSKRLSAQDWIDFALLTLAREGFESLKADILARKLKVSRGSFYWHFKDIGEFHARIIQHWMQVATEAIIADLEHCNSAEERLETLLRRAFGENAALELRMRAWADSSEAVESAVRQVDHRRRSYIEELLKELGISPPLAAARTAILYWAYLGAALARSRLEEEELDRIIAQLMPLASAQNLTLGTL